MTRSTMTTVRQKRMPMVSHRESRCTSLTSVARWSTETSSWKLDSSLEESPPEEEEESSLTSSSLTDWTSELTLGDSLAVDFEFAMVDWSNRREGGSSSTSSSSLRMKKKSCKTDSASEPAMCGGGCVVGQNTRMSKEAIVCWAEWAVRKSSFIKNDPERFLTC